MTADGPDQPAEPSETPQAAPVGPATAIDPGALLRAGWDRFTAAWPACLILYWSAVAAWWLLLNLLVIVLASFNLAIGDPALTPFLEFLHFLARFLVPTWLWLGQGIAFLRIARGQPALPEDLFRGGRYLLTALLAIAGFLALAAVPFVAVLGAIEAAIAIAGGDSLIATARQLLPARTPEDLAAIESRVLVVAAILLIVVGLAYVSIFAVRVRLRLFPWLILDREAGVVESLRTSMRLSRGRATTLFLVHLSQFTINVAGFMLCCAGLIVTLPLTRLISAITYDALAADLPPVETADEESEDDELS